MFSPSRTSDKTKINIEATLQECIVPMILYNQNEIAIE